MPRPCSSFFPLRSSLFTLRFSLLLMGACAAVLMARSAGAAAPDRPVVESVSHTSAVDYTRVVITLSRKTSHSLLTVPADPTHNLPPRIVIDFSPARRGTEAPLALPIHDGLLTQVRTGQFSPTTTRIVLDVERLDEYKTFALHSPYRLIIDVKGQVPSPATLPSTSLSPRPTPAPSVAIPPSAAVLPSETLPEPRYQIMLDPGHGGHDPGAFGAGRVAEKDIVLEISKRLGRKLADRLSVDVLFTRTTDVFVPLEERIARANAAKADLFVAVHANASTNPQLQGVETYYLNNTNDRATIRLASLENGLRLGNLSEASENPRLAYLLSDLIQNGKAEDSIALAHQLQDAVVLRARERYPAVRSLGVKKGPFYVLVGAHMPCVLVETAFMTHRVEGKHVVTSAYQESLAEGLFLGIARFLRTGRLAKSL